MADNNEVTLTVDIFDVANFNLIEFSRIYNSFINTEEEMTLNLKYMDAEGKIHEISIKNIAGIKKLLENQFSEKLNQEIQRVQEAEKALEELINNVKKELYNLIQQEIQERKDAVIDVTNLINQEVERAKKAEVDLDNKIKEEIKRAKKAEADLDNKIKEEIKRAQEAEADLNSKIDQEIQDRIENDQQLDLKITEEAERAIKAEKALDSKIDQEVERAQEAEVDLDNKIKEEVERAKKAENKLNDLINQEIQRAQSAEGNLEFNKDIKNEDGSSPDNLTNAINIVDNRLIYEINRLDQSDKDLKAYIDQRITNLINGSPDTLDTLKELADALGDDPNFATTITNKLTELTTELSNLETEIQTLDSKINQEINRAKKAETDLDNKIKEESARAQQAEENLNVKIESETQRAQQSEENIQLELDQTQAGAGLDDTGVYKANGNTYYINSATSLFNADEIIDAALYNEYERAKSAEGSLKFNKDIKNKDGSTPDNLTDAINAVDEKIEALYKFLGIKR